MKIYILCDMEGISGIRRAVQVRTDNAEYEEGRKLMMQDINAAIAGAFEGGAKEVIVADCHAGGGQVRIGDMDTRAVYELPGMGCIMPSLDKTFSGVILLGHHAMAGTINGFLDHTMSSAGWFEFSINGKVVGEIGIEAAYAGHFGVPVIMVSGDATTGKEAVATLGKVETAVVKWGIGREKAKCLPPEKAHAIIQKAAKRAVENAKSFRPYKPRLPATAQITLYRSDMIDAYVGRPNIERVNARTMRTKLKRMLDIVRWLS
ncbi:MAG: M55 family metallopeptidase [Chthoniobacterales bacterium]